MPQCADRNFGVLLATHGLGATAEPRRARRHEKLGNIEARRKSKATARPKWAPQGTGYRHHPHPHRDGHGRRQQPLGHRRQRSHRRPGRQRHPRRRRRQRQAAGGCQTGFSRLLLSPYLHGMAGRIFCWHSSDPRSRGRSFPERVFIAGSLGPAGWLGLENRGMKRMAGRRETKVWGFAPSLALLGTAAPWRPAPFGRVRRSGTASNESERTE